ncbi:LLM class flavin-dependent oxidoreductase [Nocardia otitidiscaviarum]|uniref:LLM class flavin-dependent oxidoreductase n=1 Tax=Nocardia otitidiscaviarum TaxID=1823 RepID=UPI0004A7595D|nr:LLM class flavin-dependent oxidoreductase [Nocardia otitidiscaviarum]MBF6137156.1 LLM class flavin-dependent oxidoreductase [Nocardia otitidiscaviarum]MBF6488055.1 LLM class flavin-dependent oxidoreductase [Nocardia otitidiscaviarum]
MTPLKIGYLLPTRDQAVSGDHDSGQLIDQARRAEALGFDSVWAGDSPVTRPRADPLLLLGAVAAATRRVTLGTAVLLPALRHPILLAHQLATLDRLADGRLIVGMGGGFPNANTEAQFTAVGVAFARRIGRLEESIEAMRRLWTGEEVSYTGRHFDFQHVKLAPAPTRPQGPAIWLPGDGAAALRRVARLADGWLPYPPSVQNYARDLAVIQQSAARTPTPALYATLCLDEDPERARGRLRTSIERYYNAPLEAVETIQALFAGTAREAAEWLSAYAGAGAHHVVIRLAAENHYAGLEEFADLVMPLIRTEGHL